jgi:hypothetical protein
MGRVYVSALIIMSVVCAYKVPTSIYVLEEKKLMSYLGMAMGTNPSAFTVPNLKP